QTERNAQRAPQLAHEHRVTDWLWCGREIRTRHARIAENTFKQAIHVPFVDPAQPLTTASDATAEQATGESCQAWQSTAATPQHETGAQDNAAHARQQCLLMRLLPGLADNRRQAQT